MTAGMVQYVRDKVLEMNSNDVKQRISKGIAEVIASLMDRVLNKVLVEDPFLPEQHHAAKPLYAALVPDEIFKGSHF